MRARSEAPARILEAAIAAKIDRARAYQELGRLRLESALAAPAGRDGKLDDNELATAHETMLKGNLSGGGNAERRKRIKAALLDQGVVAGLGNIYVCEALFRKQSEFVRTPKYAIEGASDEWVQKKYHHSAAVQPMIEVALGIYFTATLFYALSNGIYGTVPFLMLFQVGFLYTGLLSLIQQYGPESVEVAQGKEA